MKIMKKAMAFFLCVVMTMAMGISAFAASGSYSITINNKKDDDTAVSGHTYEAYQIFKGDLSTEGSSKVLSNIDWGDGVQGENLLAELKKAETLGGKFAACTSAEDVAEILKGMTDDQADLIAFAKVAGKYLSSTKATSTEGTGDNAGVYTISNVAAGYYLVKDQDDSLKNQDDKAYTRYILKVVGNTTANAKDETPTIDKKIVESDGSKTDANTASIGDKISYEVTGSVPNMTGYDTYYYIVNDTMSKGLTFNDDVQVKIGDDTLDKNAYKVTSETDQTTGKTSIKVVLKDFIKYKDKRGSAITITYSATLNQDAELSPTAGNPNEVKLTYSNDPNYDYDGKNNPDEPKEGAPTGESPKKEVKTYVTGLKLTKIDGSTKQALTGAEFEISGTAKKVVLVNKEIYKESTTGTYYQLTDGTYTETTPEDVTDTSKYADTSKKYEKVTVVNKDSKTEEFTAKGYVNAQGVITFEGLNAGAYKITELKEPTGYNKLKSPIDVVITENADMTNANWTVKVDNKDVTDKDGNLYAFNVENNKGATLPSTGGMGTTLFYVVGGIMMAGAAVLLVTKRRMTNG